MSEGISQFQLSLYQVCIGIIIGLGGAFLISGSRPFVLLLPLGAVVTLAAWNRMQRREPSALLRLLTFAAFVWVMFLSYVWGTR